MHAYIPCTAAATCTRIRYIYSSVVHTRTQATPPRETRTPCLVSLSLSPTTAVLWHNILGIIQQCVCVCVRAHVSLCVCFCPIYMQYVRVRILSSGLWCTWAQRCSTWAHQPGSQIMLRQQLHLNNKRKTRFFCSPPAAVCVKKRAKGCSAGVAASVCVV